MKYFVVLFGVIFAFCETTLASDDDVCSDAMLNKFTTCYKASYGDGVTFVDIIKAFNDHQLSREYWKPICINHTKFIDCIGVELVFKCFDIPSISKLPIQNADQYARVIISATFQYDLICDEFFKFSDEDAQCLATQRDAAQNECPTASSSCSELSETFKCAVELAYKCGKKVGCSMKMLTTLGMCSNEKYSCSNCDKISYSHNLAICGR